MEQGSGAGQLEKVLKLRFLTLPLKTHSVYTTVLGISLCSALVSGAHAHCGFGERVLMDELAES